MKKSIIAIITILLTISFNLFAQNTINCNCTTFPVKPDECLIPCLTKATAHDLVSKFHLDTPTAHAITALPDRANYKKLQDFKNDLPGKAFDKLNAVINQFYNDNSIKQFSSGNGDNIVGNKNITYNTYNIGDTTHRQTNNVSNEGSTRPLLGTAAKKCEIGDYGDICLKNNRDQIIKIVITTKENCNGYESQTLIINAGETKCSYQLKTGAYCLQMVNMEYPGATDLLRSEFLVEQCLSKTIDINPDTSKKQIRYNAPVIPH